MLTLREQQQSLRRILTGPPSCEPQTDRLHADPWLTEVRQSPGLAMTREIASWWLRFQIESQCIYTSRLMKRMRCYETSLDDYFSRNPTPPAIEELSRQFLSSLASYPDPLVRAVAAFELECLIPSATAHIPVAIVWDRNPQHALEALTSGAALPAPDPTTRYILTIGPPQSTAPRSVSCTPIQTTQPSS
jgi:hypothetical protein